MTTRDFLELAAAPADRVIAYGADPNRYGWLTLPTERTATPAPVVMLIHGGFWRALYGLSTTTHMAADLAASGLAVWNVEYRRIGHDGGGYPGTGDDVAAAFEHVEQLAAEFNLNASKIVLVGHSAGGHLAAWLAATRPGITAAIVLGGVVDLRRGHELGLSRNVIEELMGGSPDDRTDAYDAFSPTELPAPRCTVELFHGARDPDVPIELAERLVARHPQACTLHRFDEAGHFEFIDPSTPEYTAVKAAILRHAH
jgi:acetyl esterase/lipase